MPISVEGKKILITGGCTRIGGDSTRSSPPKAPTSSPFDVRDEMGIQLAKEATEAGSGSVTYRHVDMSNLDEIKAGVDFAADHLGGLDAVFDIAGVAPHSAAEAIPESEWAAVPSVNVNGLSYVRAAAFAYMKTKGIDRQLRRRCGANGRTDPQYGLVGIQGAVISYTRTIGKDWRLQDPANCINPVVRTPIVEETRSVLTLEERAQYAKEIEQSIQLGESSETSPRTCSHIKYKS